jgi:hypothetical protein
MDEDRDERTQQAPGSRSGGLLRNVLLLVLFTSSGRVLSLLPLDALAESPTAQVLMRGDTISAGLWLGIGLLVAAGVVWSLQRRAD